ncbi:histone deacetylase family protein [Pararhizobium haloflavum]|uniref:histone deacetylase family protein n=1 Tax=Pararhizobium haloflavum TaxID=2037914 RepID=UPI000C1A235C|nr:histone deacetylase [Pararhizobium haloflavum]
MILPIVHTPSYDANFPAHHRFPMGKYTRLAEILKVEGLAPRGFLQPDFLQETALKLAHDPIYVDQVIACAVPESIEKVIGFPVSERVSRRARAAAAGTLLAARVALEQGLACNTAGGSHHARRAHGAGFCTFNDVGVTASQLLSEGTIGAALVVDLDVHQGDGTADIFRDEARVFTLSIHAERNYPHNKIASDMDIGLPDDVKDDAYLEVVAHALAGLGGFAPDIVFYNAGIDPHEEDRLGRLSLTNDGLARRDRMVISHFRERGIPVCGVIGGGYGKDVEALAWRHAILFREAFKLA